MVARTSPVSRSYHLASALLLVACHSSFERRKKKRYPSRRTEEAFEKEPDMKKYRVKLNAEQREQLERLVSSGKALARKIMHAHILLKADESQEGPHWSDEQIQQAFGAGIATIGRVRRRFVEQG